MAGGSRACGFWVPSISRRLASAPPDGWPFAPAGFRLSLGLERTNMATS